VPCSVSRGVVDLLHKTAAKNMFRPLWVNRRSHPPQVLSSSMQRFVVLGKDSLRFVRSPWLFKRCRMECFRPNIGSLSFSSCSGPDFVGVGVGDVDDSIKTSTPTPKLAPSTHDGTRLLEEATAESHRILDRRNRHGYRSLDSALDIQQAVDAAESLLNTTNATIPLARTINQGRADGDVISLHRAFLSVIQWGILLQNPLVDSLLRLSARAHDLTLPFHIPLYKSLTKLIGEHLPLNSSAENILMVAGWARDEFGPLSADFFSDSLLALVDRQRLNDVAHIIKGMKSVHQIDILDECLTKALLRRLKSTTRSSQENHQNKSRLEQDSLDVISLLEPSIWKIFGYNSLDPTNGNLSDAIDILVTTEEGSRNTFAEELSVEHSPGDEAEQLDEESLSSFLEEHVPENSRKFSWSELAQSHEESGHRAAHNWDLELSTSGDETILEVTGELTRSEEDHMSKFAGNNILYVRSDGHRSIPDLVPQLCGKNGGEGLKYSKAFEQHILNNY
jgi:hypothetical protein